MEALAEEISRVIASPYLPSLKPLYDIVAHEADYATIEEWVNSHECQLNALVELLIDGLQQWPHVLDMLEKFLSASREFRAAALKQRPEILETFLLKAVQSSEAWDKFAPICLAALSSPLPDDVPMPASALPFLRQLLNQTSRTPSLRNLGRLYQLLDSSSSALLETLPDEAEELQNQLNQILHGDPRQETGPLCLGTFAIILQWRRGMADPCAWTPSSLLEEEGSRNMNMQRLEKFFRSDRGIKTVNLIVLSAIQVMSRSGDMPEKFLCDQLHMGAKTLECVDGNVKEEWLRDKDPGTKVLVDIRKLIRKVDMLDRVSQTQVSTLQFILALTGGPAFPDQLLPRLKNVLSDSLRGRLDITRLDLAPLCGRLDEECVADVLKECLSLLLAGGDFSSSHRRARRNCSMIVRGMAQSVRHSSALRTFILSALVTNEFEELIVRFTTSIKSPQDALAGKCCTKGCLAGLHRYHRQCQLHLCNLFLSTALHAMVDDSSVRLDADLANDLLTRQSELSVPTLDCPRNASRQRSYRLSPISLLEAPSTPAPKTMSVAWQDRMRVGLMRDAEFKVESVVRSMGEICRDLEARCENVERPLREQVLISANLQTSNSLLESRNVEREAEMETALYKVQDLESDVVKLTETNQILQAENILLVTKADDVKRQAEEHMLESRLELERLEASQATNLGHLQHMLSKREGQFEKADLEAKELRQHLLSSRCANSEQEAQLGSLHNALEIQTDELRLAREELRDTSVGKGALEAEMARLTVSFADDLQTARRDFEKDLDHIKAVHDKESTAMTEDIQTLREHVRKATDQLEEVRKARDDKIQRLTDEISKYRTDLGLRTDELMRAQKMRERIMSAMQAPLTDARSSRHKKVKESVTLPVNDASSNDFAEEQREEARAETVAQEVSEISDETPVIPRTRLARDEYEVPNANGKRSKKGRDEAAAAAAAAEEDFNSSFNSHSSAEKSGPTPKRAKPRKSVKLPRTPGTPGTFFKIAYQTKSVRSANQPDFSQDRRILGHVSKANLNRRSPTGKPGRTEGRVNSRLKDYEGDITDRDMEDVTSGVGPNPFRSLALEEGTESPSDIFDASTADES